MKPSLVAKDRPEPEGRLGRLVAVAVKVDPIDRRDPFTETHGLVVAARAPLSRQRLERGDLGVGELDAEQSRGGAVLFEGDVGVGVGVHEVEGFPSRIARRGHLRGQRDCGCGSDWLMVNVLTTNRLT